LLIVQGGVHGQFQHANDAVHRRADLMAHVGQELRFCPVGLFGVPPCLHQLGDVVVQPQRAFHLFILHQLNAQGFHVGQRAVFPLQPHRRFHHPAGAGNIRHQAAFKRVPIHVQQRVNRPADHLVMAVPKQGFEIRVGG
jgi:hypothetical protein